MSNFGLFASKFHDSTNSLRQFDEALRYLKRPNILKESPETQVHIQRLLFVLRPIAETLNGRLSETVNFDERSIVEILHQRQMKDWQRSKELIIQLTDKLVSGELDISETDFKMLNDIADAIDTECANLFRRMSGRV